MAIKLKCPCGERLSAPESAVGKRGKCSKCGMTFIIPGPKAATPAASTSAAPSKPAPKPADDPDFGLPDLGEDLSDLGDDFGDLLDDALNEPSPAPSTSETNPFASPTATTAPSPGSSKQRGGVTRVQMNTLANGIKLVFWGTVMVVCASVLAALGGLFLPTLALISLGISVVGGLISTVGRIVCLGGPTKAGGKGLLIAAVACDLIAVGISLVAVAGTAIPFADLVTSLLNLATLILFLLFIKSVATSIGQEHLAKDAWTIIILVVIAIVLLIATPLSIFIFPLLPLVTVLGFIGVGLAAVFKYLNLLQYTAEAVRPG